MRVVMFQYVTGWGGAQRCVVEVARRLQDRGVEVCLVEPYGDCQAFAETARAEEISHRVLLPRESVRAIRRVNPVARLGRMLRELPRFLRLRKALGQFLKQFEPDALWTIDWKSTAVLAVPRRLRKAPVILQLHGWFLPSQVPGWARWLCRHRCESLQAVSTATRNSIICQGVNPRKVHVLHNPINVESIQQLADRPLAAPLPQTHRPIRIVMPALYTRAKGLDTAVEALAKVVRAGADAVLWLAGRDSNPASGYVRTVKENARQLGIADRVEWLGLRDDMPQVFRASTLMILPSHTEGLPRSIQEAMALEIPVVATPVGGVPDLITPGLTGLLHEVDDADGLARSILELDNKEALRRSVSACALEYVRRNYSEQQQVEKILAVLEELTSVPR